jgi:hypothetical protein
MATICDTKAEINLNVWELVDSQISQLVSIFRRNDRRDARLLSDGLATGKPVQFKYEI